MVRAKWTFIVHHLTGRVVLFLGLLGIGCATNPVTGRREFSLISEGQEIEIGRTESAKVASQIGLYPDAAVQAYVSGIGLRLARASERPDLPWSFQVVDDPAVNAFALPGGFIFVTRGILTHLNSEAELAAVIGHEIGHVTARHSVQAISRQQLAQVGLGIGSIFSSTVRDVGGFASAGLGVLFLKYGRDAEDQADQLGFRYSLQDGYDVRAMSDVFRTLQGVSGSGGGGKVPQWLSTHPDPENRVEKNEARLAALGRDLSQAVRNRNTYLAQVNGMVFGPDPRQGYFEGTRFYHPDLQFQIDFPTGWQTANQTAAVVAGSPSEDALAALSIETGVTSVDSAYRAFAASNGITASSPRRGQVGGLSAITAGFRATSDQGELVGEATFLVHRGTVYRILGYGSAAGFRTHGASLRETAQSFAPVTDRAVLDRQPMRVSIVRLRRETPLDRFMASTPSSIPLEQLALINGIAVDGILPAGSAKRVR